MTRARQRVHVHGSIHTIATRCKHGSGFERTVRAASIVRNRTASSRFAGLPCLGYGAHQLLFSPSTTCAGHNSSFHHSTAVNLSLDRGSPSRQGVQGVHVFGQCGSSELQLSKFILRSNRCITISTVTTAEVLCLQKTFPVAWPPGTSSLEVAAAIAMCDGEGFVDNMTVCLLQHGQEAGQADSLH